MGLVVVVRWGCGWFRDTNYTILNLKSELKWYMSVGEVWVVFGKWDKAKILIVSLN